MSTADSALRKAIYRLVDGLVLERSAVASGEQRERVLLGAVKGLQCSGPRWVWKNLTHCALHPHFHERSHLVMTGGVDERLATGDAVRGGDGKRGRGGREREGRERKGKRQRGEGERQKEDREGDNATWVTKEHTQRVRRRSVREKRLCAFACVFSTNLFFLPLYLSLPLISIDIVGCVRVASGGYVVRQ
jgi:hypothetical protein